jgi:MFS family permease
MKKIAMGVAGLLSGLFLLCLPVILIFGMTWVSEIVSPWLVPAFLCTLAISIFILGPLSVIRKTRGFSASGLMVASYVFGGCLWITSLLLTYELWGMLAVFIGLVLLGIGIVPVALLAVLFHGQWSYLLDLVVLIVATFGTRLVAVWLAENVEAERHANVESKSNENGRTGQQNRVIQLGVLVAVVVLTLTFGRWLPRNANLSAAEVFSQTAGSVVRIEIHRQDGLEFIGSGFATDFNGHPYIVTNKHVVENANRVRVGIQENLLFDVPNYWLARDVDLAALEIPPELQLKALPLRRTPIQAGETLYAIGFPMGLAKSITQGLVTATYADALQFDAPISSGNSGGPVLDVHAEVIGVVAIGFKEGAEVISQNLNFAIPVTNFPPLATFQSAPHITVPLAVSTPSPVRAEGPFSPAQKPTVTPFPPRAELEQTTSEKKAADVSIFVKQFVAAGNSSDSGFEASFYADKVDYFDNGKVTKTFVEQDLQKYNRRWPQRRYWTVGEPTIGMVNPAHDIAEATVTIGFVVQSPQRVISGTCSDDILVINFSTDPKIGFIRTKMLNRQVKTLGK